jgi:hypothetical protein
VGLGAGGKNEIGYTDRTMDAFFTMRVKSWFVLSDRRSVDDVEGVSQRLI